MARAPMVTRELIGTEATVLVVDTVNATTDYKHVTIQGKYKTTEHLLKAIKKIYETDTYRIVKVIDAKEVHKLYGMATEQFYTHAIELDPETRKPIETRPIKGGE